MKSLWRKRPACAILLPIKMYNKASNNQIKDWRKLLMGKYRKKNKLFLAEGLRCVEQIIQNGLIDVTALLSDGSEAAEQLDRGEIPVYELSNDDFASISDTETPQGVTAVCRMPAEASIDEIARGDGLIVALDAIQDPGNMGTIIRTAAWFGVTAILAGTGCVDPYHPKVVRSTAGATGAVPIIKGDLEDLFSRCESSGWQAYLLDGAEDAAEINKITPDKKSVLVIGNEANGISQNLFTENRIRVRISGKSRLVESLNASVAGGIALEHFSGKPDRF